jgi:hypothetical protein
MDWKRVPAFHRDRYRQRGCVLSSVSAVCANSKTFRTSDIAGRRHIIRPLTSGTSLTVSPKSSPLAAGLRRRQEKGLSQLDLAAKLQSSQSRVAKMEAGDPSVSLDLLIRSLISLGASARELSQIITTPRAA